VSGTIALSLVSHTNAGKTTLARTLLGSDIGEVRDAPHVTEFADVFTLIRTDDGDSLQLWDTPGFGDSVRLLRRVRQSGSALGWFLAEVWDRWRDRPFWSSQQALRNVRDEADVVLYLVSAAEGPAAAAYVAPEMELLGWTGKPVLVLLNQLGAPRAAPLEDADVQRWRGELAAHVHVAAVLPLDAFARCWVQEFALFDAVEAALRPGQRALMQRLNAAWRARRLATFDAAIQTLARGLAHLAAAREPVPDAGLRERLRAVGSALGLGASPQRPLAAAERALAAAYDDEARASTAQLIELHGLAGQAQGEIIARLDRLFELRAKLDEGKAGLLGGALTGALAGLKADVATGGLTLGGGLLAGGVLGALGGAALARGVNRIRGRDQSWLAWSGAALDAMVDAALLRYLAVAHFGRGRGEWAQGEAPPHWAGVVAAALAPQRARFAALWAARGERAADAAATQALAAALQALLDQVLRDVLAHLYPATPVPTADAAAAPR
jgi:GTPase SAR1 family protein